MRDRDSFMMLAPMRIEARALRQGGSPENVARIGMGRKAAIEAVTRLKLTDVSSPVAIAGFCGGLRSGIQPGDAVVATEIQGPGEPIQMPAAAAVAHALRRAGLRVHEGPIISATGIAQGKKRSRLADEGAIAVDMESFWLLVGHGTERSLDHRCCVARIVLDTQQVPSGAWFKAYRSLVRAGGALRAWAAAVGPRTVLVAAPRSFCSGVNRAIRTTEEALAELGAPIYVLHEIVHNTHVVGSFRERGVVFVPEIDQVPEGETVIFSAHGVGQLERRMAEERGLRVIDATCPLVARVHAKAKHFVHGGYQVVLIGKKGHDEVEGVVGEARDRIKVVERAEDIVDLSLEAGSKVAVLSQTTLIPHEVEALTTTLRERFPNLHVPSDHDVCYASQNRQEAVRRMAPECDLVLVLGSRNSSNSKRLVEEANGAGTRAYLIDDESDVDLAWLAGVRTVGLTAGASAPEALVDRMIRFIGALGSAEVREARPQRQEGDFSSDGGTN